MTQYEFLKELEESLKGQVSQQTIDYNLNFYREYISSQVAAGKTVDEIMETLGTPQMLAKTIILAEETEGDNSGIFGQQEKNNRTYEGGKKSFTEKAIGFWEKIRDGELYQKLIAAIVVIIGLYLVISILFAVVKILFWPVVILAVVYFIYRFYQERKR